MESYFEEILFNGMVNRDYREDLKWYFIVYRRRATKTHFYAAKDFYETLLYLINRYKKHIYSKYETEKGRLQTYIDAASNNEYEPMQKYYGFCIDKTGVTYEDYKKKYNEQYVIYYTSQLKRLKPLGEVFQIDYLLEAESILKKLLRNAVYAKKARQAKKNIINYNLN